VRQLLERQGVRVVLTLRRNALLEALSWHRARDLGVSQFTASASTSAAGARAEMSGASSCGGAVRAPVTVDVPQLLAWVRRRPPASQPRARARHLGRHRPGRRTDCGAAAANE
jgi:hypothetical protein